MMYPETFPEFQSLFVRHCVEAASFGFPEPLLCGAYNEGHPSSIQVSPQERNEHAAEDALVGIVQNQNDDAIKAEFFSRMCLLSLATAGLVSRREFPGLRQTGNRMSAPLRARYKTREAISQISWTL